MIGVNRVQGISPHCGLLIVGFHSIFWGYKVNSVAWYALSIHQCCIALKRELRVLGSFIIRDWFVCRIMVLSLRWSWIQAALLTGNIGVDMDLLVLDIQHSMLHEMDADIGRIPSNTVAKRVGKLNAIFLMHMPHGWCRIWTSINNKMFKEVGMAVPKSTRTSVGIWIEYKVIPPFFLRPVFKEWLGYWMK